MGHELRLVEAMRYATLGGGKRMRGFLVMEVSALFGVPRPQPHGWRRRWRCCTPTPSCMTTCRRWTTTTCGAGSPARTSKFDEATAILAGDALQALAFEVLADPDTHSDPQARCELVSALGLASGARGMAGGQMIDMATEGQVLTAGEVARLQALKTGRLIQYSAEAGAILGRAAAPLRAHVAAYGRDLGAAFQIADDVLDAVGTTEGIGKTAGKDEAAGKATLVALLGVDRARAQAEALAAQAAGHLAAFGDRADRLRALAAYVVARQN